MPFVKMFSQYISQMLDNIKYIFIIFILILNIQIIYSLEHPVYTCKILPIVIRTQKFR